MNRHRDNPFRTLVTACVLFLVGYALEIAADVWVVNHSPSNDPFARLFPVPPTHIRHYVLPMLGFALGAFCLFRRAAPAARNSLWAVETGRPIAGAFGHAVRALAWTVAAIAAFQAAAWLQHQLFGFFLPP